MKIRYITTTAGAIVLGDDAQRIFIRGYDGAQQVSPQVTPLAGKGSRPALFARTLGPNSRSFEIDREHRSAAEAFVYSETHPDDLPVEGTLEITDDGGTVYLDAKREPVKLVTRNGKTTIFSYQFTCGAVRKSLKP